MDKILELVGPPRTGSHAIRVADFAVVDIIGTAALATGVSQLTGYSFLTSFAGLFIIGQGFHFAFKVDTKFMETIGVKFDESDDIHLSKCPFAP